MHPNGAFRFADDAVMLDYALKVSFSHIFASSPKLADVREPRPDRWTLAKMHPAKVDAMLRAIVGFEVGVTAIRNAAKLHQHKSEANRQGIRAGIRLTGNASLAEAMP
jgi:transcriptional regulator